MILVMFPMLIYISTLIKFENKFFNFLGELSFGLYAYQTVLRVLEFYGLIVDMKWLFVVLIVLVLVDCLIKEIIKISKKSRKNP